MLGTAFKKPPNTRIRGYLSFQYLTEITHVLPTGKVSSRMPSPRSLILKEQNPRIWSRIMQMLLPSHSRRRMIGMVATARHLSFLVIPLSPLTEIITETCGWRSMMVCIRIYNCESGIQISFAACLPTYVVRCGTFSCSMCMLDHG